MLESVESVILQELIRKCRVTWFVVRTLFTPGISRHKAYFLWRSVDVHPVATPHSGSCKWHCPHQLLAFLPFLVSVSDPGRIAYPDSLPTARRPPLNNVLDPRVVSLTFLRDMSGGVES
ncbi:hypothetical protein AAG570_003823 [Ranatra chinensis]|uniref:Uncharacterized protein n=1 Tax=Ranatra chinensis TaxID=642074 RepID=A0ABD0Y1Y8_9HEMI